MMMDTATVNTAQPDDVTAAAGTAATDNNDAAAQPDAQADGADVQPGEQDDDSQPDAPQDPMDVVHQAMLHAEQAVAMANMSVSNTVAAMAKIYEQAAADE
jgi:hypothetical protein